jgi:hypothetical protein
MSRAYDAKHATLRAYPIKSDDTLEEAIELFLGYCDCSEDDFEYEFDETPEQYIYSE